MKKKTNQKVAEDAEIEKFPLPEYPAGEDIFRKAKELPLKEEIQETMQNRTVKLGDDLDVPGSELDDSDEEIGEEDEENNYYSIGGDDHNDLEEDPEEGQ
jgi:hypothetical protein